MQVVEAGESDAASRWLLCCVVSLDMVLMLQELLSGDWVRLCHFAGRSPACSSLKPLAAASLCRLSLLSSTILRNYLMPHTPHSVSPEATVRGKLPQGPVLAGSGSARLYLEDLRWQSMLHSLAVSVSCPLPPHSPRLTIRVSGPR
jgi:hypothetical protein